MITRLEASVISRTSQRRCQVVVGKNETTELYQRLTKAEDKLKQVYSDHEEVRYEILETKLEMLLLTLNETGQKTALQRMVELAQIPDYQNKYFTAEERSAILQECKE